MIIIYDSTVVLTRNLFKVVNYDCRTIQDWPIWSIINYHHHNFIVIFVVVVVDFSLRTQKNNQFASPDIRSPSLIYIASEDVGRAASETINFTL